MIPLTIEEAYDPKLCDSIRRGFSECLECAKHICNSALNREDAILSPFVNQQSALVQQHLRHLRALGAYASAHYLMNLEDHIETLVHLLGNPRAPAHVWSYMSLARVIAENACMFAELEDVSKQPKKRFLFIAAVLLNDTKGMINVAQDIFAHAKSDRTEAIRLVEDCRKIKFKAEEMIEQAGISLKIGNGGRITSLEWDQVKQSLKIDMTALMKKRLNHVPAPYRISSAVVHGQHFMLSTERRGDELLAEYDSLMLEQAAIICLDSIAAMVRSCTDEDDVFFDLSNKWMREIISIKYTC